MRSVLLILLALLLSGCASTVTDPSRAHLDGSTVDFLGPKYENLKAYLVQRHQVLEDARIHLSELDDELIQRGIELRQIQQKLQSQEVQTQLSREELRKAREDVEEARRLHAESHRKVMLAQADEERIRDEIRRTNEGIEADRANIAELKDNVSKLENEVDTVEDAMDRLLSVRTRQALRMEESLPEYQDDKT